jgi:hypothetical protein
MVASSILRVSEWCKGQEEASQLPRSPMTRTRALKTQLAYIWHGKGWLEGR